MCQSNKKYCYRCKTCLAIFVSSEYFNNCYPVQCLVCLNTGIDQMGVIGPDKKRKTEKLQCKCDNRCVWARGPICDCVCGGANHQSGFEGYTLVTKDNGITKLTCTDAETCTKHRAQASEYKGLLKLVNDIPADSAPNVKWLKRALLYKASNSRLHTHRIKLLKNFLEKYNRVA